MTEHAKAIGATVLIVDDEEHILQVLQLKLGNAGFVVRTARDGEEALDAARADRPDLVITDLQMPYMNGLELVRALAADDTLATIPVLMLTARGYSLGDGELDGTAVRDVLSKPFSPRQVLEAVEGLVAASAHSDREAA